MNKFKHFLGKVCTILTYQTTRHYSDEQHVNVFTGVVEEIDEYGVTILTLPQMKRKAYFQFPIVGIIEEEVIPITDEEEKEIRDKYARDNNLPLPQNNEKLSLGGIKELVSRVKTKVGDKK